MKEESKRLHPDPDLEALIQKLNTAAKTDPGPDVSPLETAREGKVERRVTPQARAVPARTRWKLPQRSDEGTEWQNAEKAVLEKHSISGSYPGYMGIVSDDQIGEIGETYLCTMSQISSGSRYLVNARHENYRYVGLILRALPMSKIIYCRRNMNY